MWRWVFRKIFRKGTLILFVIAFLGGASYALGWSHLFVVKNVFVFGAPTQFDEQYILGKVPIGERLARLNTRAISDELSGLAWLDSSTFRTEWIKGSITVRVTVRKPIATVNRELIDASGALFQLQNFDRSKLPNIEANSHQTQMIAVSLLEQLPISLLKDLTVLSVPGIHSVTLHLVSDTKGAKRNLTIVWGDVTNTPLKVRVYQSLLALTENANITEMDLSAPHAPIVK